MKIFQKFFSSAAFLTTIVGGSSMFARDMFIGIDIQRAFVRDFGFKGVDETPPLEVPIAVEAVDRMATLVKLAYESKSYTLLTRDYHFPLEWGANGSEFITREFSKDGDNFPPHADVTKEKADVNGPALIGKIMHAIDGREILELPNMVPTLEESSFNFIYEDVDFFEEKTNREKAFDPENVVLVDKNGLGSYSFFVNPLAREFLDMTVRAKTNIYVFGVATNFCVRAAVMGLLQAQKGELSVEGQSYPLKLPEDVKIYLVTDAIAGIEGIKNNTPENSLKEMFENGAIGITTADVVEKMKVSRL